MNQLPPPTVSPVVATVSSGLLSVIAQNSAAITVIILAVTGVASIWLGIRNADANERRYTIKKREIALEVAVDLETAGKFREARAVRQSIMLKYGY